MQIILVTVQPLSDMPEHGRQASWERPTSTTSPRHSTHSALARELLKRTETGQELNTGMQVQTQAQKVVFQVDVIFLSTRKDTNLDSVFPCKVLEQRKK